MAIVEVDPNAALDAPRTAPVPQDAPLDRLSQPGIARTAAQVGSYGLRGALGAAGTLLGDMPNMLFRGLDMTVGRYIVDPLANAVLGPPRQTDAERDAGVQPQSYTQRGRETAEANPLLPTGANLIAAGTRAGLVDRPELAPRTRGERYVTATAEGAGGALPFVPLGGATIPAAIGRTLFSGAGGGAGGEALVDLVSSDLARRMGTTPGWEAPARLTGNIIGGLGGNAVYSAGERGVNAARGVGPALESYRAAEVTPRMVGDVTQSPTGQLAQNMGERVVGGGGRMGQAARQTLDEFETSMERAVIDLGDARTPQQAGNIIQNTANTWVNNWRQSSTAAWNRLFAILPEDAQMTLDRTRAAINNLGQRMRDVPDVSDAMQGDQFARLRNAINASPTEWRSESVRTLRSIVGDLIDTANLGGNIPQGELRQLYAALSDDVRAAVAMRPGGLDAWNAANEVTRTGHAVIDRTVRHITRPTPDGANAINPETAFGWVVGQASMRGGGATRLNEVRNVMESTTPDSFGNVGSAVLSRAAADVANTRNPASALNLLGTRGTSLSDEARETLFGSAGRGTPRERIDALADLAARMRATARLSNPSGTAGTAANLDWLRDVGTGVGGVGGLLAGGGGTEAALGGLLGRIIAGPLLGRGVAMAATSPNVARFAAAPTSGLGAGMALRQALANAAVSPAARAQMFPSGDRRR